MRLSTNLSGPAKSANAPVDWRHVANLDRARLRCSGGRRCLGQCGDAPNERCRTECLQTESTPELDAPPTWNGLLARTTSDGFFIPHLVPPRTCFGVCITISDRASPKNMQVHHRIILTSNQRVRYAVINDDGSTPLHPAGRVRGARRVRLGRSLRLPRSSLVRSRRDVE